MEEKNSFNLGGWLADGLALAYRTGDFKRGQVVEHVGKFVAQGVMTDADAAKTAAEVAAIDAERAAPPQPVPEPMPGEGDEPLPAPLPDEENAENIIHPSTPQPEEGAGAE